MYIILLYACIDVGFLKDPHIIRVSCYTLCTFDSKGSFRVDHLLQPWFGSLEHWAVRLCLPLLQLLHQPQARLPEFVHVPGDHAQVRTCNSTVCRGGWSERRGDGARWRERSVDLTGLARRPSPSRLDDFENACSAYEKAIEMESDHLFHLNYFIYKILCRRLSRSNTC